MTELRAPAGGRRRAIVREVIHPGPRSVVLRLEVPDRVDHLPGQHYVVRLTAEDGYTAQRSYSIASAPSEPLLELFVERLDDGEVSGYLADVVEPGDELDVRGPIGGWFVWTGDTPAVGVGGGSGVVPLVSMLRHAVHLGRPDLLGLAVSARTLAELPYADELLEAAAFLALSRQDAPDGRAAHRLTRPELAALTSPGATYFVCGSSGFAETVSTSLVAGGVPAAAIRVERFGPTA
ncbi:MAG: FAD-binding oxidoreductase [Streptosporangiaceae bacterium]